MNSLPISCINKMNGRIVGSQLEGSQRISFDIACSMVLLLAATTTGCFSSSSGWKCGKTLEFFTGPMGLYVSVSNRSQYQI